MRFDIVKKVYLWLGFGILAMLIAIFLFFKFTRLSIEFTGGINAKIETSANKDKIKSDIDEAVKSIEGINTDNYSIGILDKDGMTEILIKLRLENDQKFNELSTQIQKTLVEKNDVSGADKILEVSMIGPSVGDYMKSSAEKAIIIGMLFMGVYILFAFMGMRQFFSPALLGGVTIFTMLFDISIPAGVYGLMSIIDPTMQIDSIFIIAILTVMGYSINDTIIIFDRIRENFITHESQVNSGKITYRKIFEESLWQTMRRSLGTVISTLLIIIAMYFFGTGALKMFAFTLLFGIAAGSYSSIFIAAPMAYLLSGKYKKEEKIQDKAGAL